MIATLRNQARAGKCFIAFARRDEGMVNLWLADAVSESVEDGFIMAPFQGNPIGIRRKDASISELEIPIGQSGEIALGESDGEEAFVNLVKKGVEAIHAGAFAKVVLSRMENHRTDPDIFESFAALLSAYPTAFRYLWYAPQTGFWMGASPEVLLVADENRFETMALAGTQLFGPHLFWPEKEREEQFFVTHFITDSLRPLTDDLYVSQPYTAQAGRLAHIRTDIKGKFKDGFSWKDVVPILHPTPAVCGYPKLDAMRFILENEGYDRSFYSGYLGEVSRSKTDLYVNLRCMRYADGIVSLLMGCGITADSNPASEYIETVNKSMTIKKILR